MQTPADAPPLPPNTIEIIVALSAVFMLAGALALIVAGLVRRMLTRLEGGKALAPGLPKATVRAVFLLTFVIASAALAFPAMGLAGVDLHVGLEGRDLARWAGRSGLQIAVILLVVITANRIVSTLMNRAQRELVTGSSLADHERQKRAQTIGRTFSHFISAILWIAGALMILRTLDVDVTPLLTGAGIVGLAIGFGAQTLVKDVITGFFLILEDQVRVGDVVLVNNTAGLVEQINLRTMVLRDVDGTVHVVPNGEIRVLSNRSKDYSYSVLDIGIDYDDDIDKAVEAVKAAAEDMRTDPQYATDMLEPLEVMGVDDFKASSVTLRFRVKTVPLRQWDVGRALRRRIKMTFDNRGIRIPVQQMELTIRNSELRVVNVPDEPDTPSRPPV
jgi:small conductance mechanosensitive channel